MTHFHRVDSLPIDLSTEEDIIRLCKEHESRHVGFRVTSRVVIQDGVAIKYGQVTRQEVDNQLRAYDILDFNIVRVPLIYWYFTREGTDYLAMECVTGKMGSRRQSPHGNCEGCDHTSLTGLCVWRKIRRHVVA